MRVCAARFRNDVVRERDAVLPHDVVGQVAFSGISAPIAAGVGEDVLFQVEIEQRQRLRPQHVGIVVPVKIDQLGFAALECRAKKSDASDRLGRRRPERELQSDHIHCGQRGRRHRQRFVDRAMLHHDPASRAQSRAVAEQRRKIAARWCSPSCRSPAIS